VNSLDATPVVSSLSLNSNLPTVLKLKVTIYRFASTIDHEHDTFDFHTLMMFNNSLKEGTFSVKVNA